MTLHKILVIEDDEDLKENICEIFRLSGFEVASAENGKLGIEKAMVFSPALIVCDINMPVMDGLEVLERIRSDKELKTTPFVFLTALNTMQDLRSGMNLGADDYLTKPFDFNQLLKVVDSRLNKQNEIVTKSEKKYDQLKNAIGIPITAVIDDPLRNIERLAELISGQLLDLTSQDIGEITRLIASDAAKLRKEVNKIVFFYRIEALKRNLESLQGFAEEKCPNAKSIISVVALNTLKESHRENDLNLHVDDVTLDIPREFLEYILKELLSNACHFSAKGTKIKVTGLQDGDKYSLTIQDFGVGFHKEKSLKDVGPYLRFGDEKGKNDGLGLGLYNARTLVELFGSEMTLNAESGVGTSIGMRFNLSR